jgi:ribosomal-protein-alanine N-acetyltransferase
MEKRYRVRRARPGDLDRIEQIERASFGRDAYDRKLFAELHRTCGELFLVVEHKRRVCGYMVTCRRGESPRAELVSVAVDPAARRHGAASVLLESTLRRLRRRRAARLGLMVKVTNRAARRFYEKYGFSKIRRVSRYYEDGADGVWMAREV